MPTQKLEFWEIEGAYIPDDKKLVPGASLKYKGEVTLRNRVPMAAYQELELMFDACLDSATLVFHKTMLSPSNTKPENRRFELRGFVLSSLVDVNMAEESNAKSV